MKTVAVLQSNYMPWKGYFDIIKKSDVFIFYDDVQYTKRDWRNRNKIKTANGVKWITIPCGTSEKRLICDVKLKDDWQRDHWNKIRNAYSKAPCFKEMEDFFLDIYDESWPYLWELNRYSIMKISRFLGIETRFDDSRRYTLFGAKQRRLLDLLTKARCTKYISGPAAKDYIEEDKFKEVGIELEWMEYEYPEYPQLHGEFVHGVSIIDMLMNLGKETPKYIWG